MKQYGKPVVVAINKFVSDTPSEIQALKDYISEHNVKGILADVWAKGGAGATELASELVNTCDQKAEFKPLYNQDDDILDKLTKIVTNIYGGNKVELSGKAQRQLKKLSQTWLE